MTRPRRLINYLLSWLMQRSLLKSLSSTRQLTSSLKISRDKPWLYRENKTISTQKRSLVVILMTKVTKFSLNKLSLESLKIARYSRKLLSMRRRKIRRDCASKSHRRCSG